MNFENLDLDAALAEIRASEKNEQIGTKKSGYVTADEGPFDCEHCLHYIADTKKKGFCENTYVLADDDVDDGKLGDKTLKIVGAKACCNYFRKDMEMKAAAELPEMEGFTDKQKKELTEQVLNIPLKVLKLVSKIKASPNLGAMHGRYDKSENIIEFNPANFSNKTTFGTDDPVDIDEFVMSHEYGHALQETFDEQQANDWKALSGWKLGTGSNQAKPYVEKRPGWPKGISNETHDKDAKFVREYSKKNNREDFADCFAYYVTGNESKIPDDKLNFLKALLNPV
jgi:hypothetical protein